MRICPKCRTAYPSRGRSTCAKDGARLVEAEELAAATNDPLLGRNLTGRFAIVERIGAGGMGTVYRADQAGLDRPVALKVLKKELIADQETVARFHREAKAMSMLMHPNTVRVFDFGEDDDGHLFLAMELLEGELLTAFIEREGSPPIDEAVETTMQILRSLSEAHSKGLVHRDLKPDNIMLARVEGRAKPVVKVLDFGIAKVFRAEEKIDQLETQAGTVFGTPRYMSPEQAQGKELDHRSDLYSVGVLLYQMLTGKPPFVDDDAVVVMAKHIREEPVPVRDAVPERPIPRSLERVVEKALAKEPRDRYPDADAFEAALADALPDVALEAERWASGRPSSFVTTVRELPRVPLIIGAVVVLLAIVAAIALVVLSEPPQPVASGPPPTPPSATPAPDPAPTPPGALQPRLVHVQTTPEGASLTTEDGASLGTTPADVPVGQAGLSLRVELAGYEARDLILSPGDPATRVLTLTRAVADPPTRVEPTDERRGPSTGRRRRRDPDPAGGPDPTPTGPDGDDYERWD